MNPLSVATAGQTCPEPFVGLYEGCYYFHTELTTYNKSVGVCREMGATLAQIDSAEEEQALTKYMEGIKCCVCEFKSICKIDIPSTVYV